MDTSDQSKRAPCPDRIVVDAGGGFALGAIGGTAFHFLKGLRNSPSGARFISGSEAVRVNVPGLAGSWGTWCGLFSTFDCALAYTRQKEDPWNSILAGAATSGLISMRQGFLPMGKAALGTAIFFAFIEGINLKVRRAASSVQQEQQQQQHMMPPVMIREAPKPPQMGDAAPSWFGGFFSKKKEEVKSYVKDTVLESFEAPMPPTFDFE